MENKNNMENKVIPEAINEIVQVIAACIFEGGYKLTKEELETMPQFVCESFASNSDFELIQIAVDYVAGYYDFEFESLYDLVEKAKLIMSYHMTVKEAIKTNLEEAIKISLDK